jgi:hypothetical protein
MSIAEESILRMSSTDFSGSLPDLESRRRLAPFDRHAAEAGFVSIKLAASKPLVITRSGR